MKTPTLLERAGVDALEDLPIAVAVHDTENNVLWTNRPYRDAAGASRGELEGRKCYAVWGGDELCNDCPVVEALRTGEVSEARLTPECQGHSLEPGGAWLAKAQPIKDEEGKIVGVIELAIDITEQVRNEVALRRSESHLAETQRIAHIGFWEVDLTTGKVAWSDELYRIMQVDPDDPMDLDTAMREFLHPDDRARAEKAVQDAMVSGDCRPSSSGASPERARSVSSGARGRSSGTSGANRSDSWESTRT